MEAIVINFIFGAFSGVAGNYIYETLKKHFKSEKLNKLVEYKNSNDIESFKEAINNAVEFNQKLEEDLNNLANKSGVVQNNVNGNNINTNSGTINITNNYVNRENDPKH